MANSDAWNQGWKIGAGKQKSGHGILGKASPSSFAKGGKVRRTGKALVHKGEVVLTAQQAKACATKKGKKKSTGKKTTRKKA